MKSGSQDERKRQSPQEKWNDFADNTHKPGGGILLDCLRSQVYGIQEEMSSTYTAKICTRGVVIHMLRGREMCTDSAVIHKANAQ